MCMCMCMCMGGVGSPCSELSFTKNLQTGLQVSGAEYSPFSWHVELVDPFGPCATESTHSLPDRYR